MMGQRISTQTDFSRVAVYRRDGPSGPVMSVAFSQKEFVTDAGTTVLIVGGAFLLMGASVLAVNVGAALPQGWLVLGILAAWVAFFATFKQPWTISRTIELDFGADRLAVFRNGKIDGQQQLSRLANLTVEDHPDAELARLNRQMKGEKSPRVAEKQHCLVGWFGAGGGEKVVLITRAEFPSRNSLFEVRQAMLWAMEKGAGATTGGTGAPTVKPQTGGGIKPPLD
ncbi:MAG: hypothetical protein Q8P46_03360 [Hyphomicrobiales bacterium]|nr:hypothetical protein [Hyphomicrobiales bacterium]